MSGGEELAASVATHRLVTPRQCFCGDREPYDERDAGFHRPEWHIAHVLTALMPVVDRIANQRAAALEADVLRLADSLEETSWICRSERFFMAKQLRALADPS